ncbi:MAG: hypothetical protein JWL83_4327 [Actinomycetia bacterium]|jgi:hypothetical protein|nr:hypothetical protein [Actinomycetes bacterium]
MERDLRSGEPGERGGASVATPRMRKQLRLLAVLAAFVAVIIVLAFVGAFRNQGTNAHLPTAVRIDARSLAEGTYAQATIQTDVVLDGSHYSQVALFIVRTSGQVHALWAHSTRPGCRVVPFRGQAFVDASRRGEVRFVDPCGGATWALDGRCVAGPCPRGLDEFAVYERGGVAFADLAALHKSA